MGKPLRQAKYYRAYMGSVVIHINAGHPMAWAENRRLPEPGEQFLRK